MLLFLDFLTSVVNASDAEMSPALVNVRRDRLRQGPVFFALGVSYPAAVQVR